MKSKFTYFIIFLIALFNLIFFVRLVFKEKRYQTIENKFKKFMYISGLILGMACSFLVMYIEMSYIFK